MKALDKITNYLVVFALGGILGVAARVTFYDTLNSENLAQPCERYLR